MRSTMMDVPLTVTSIMRHGEITSPHSMVITATAGGTRRSTFSEVAANARRLAAGLRRLGVRDSDRLATFMWNSQEHVEAYLAVPAMRAVLHTLNIRLSPEQIAYIVGHAEDEIVLVDASLLRSFNTVIADVPGIHTVITVGDTDADEVAAAAAAGKTVLSYLDLLAAADDEFAWPSIDERDAAILCYTGGTTGDPKGVVYSHRSLWLEAQSACTVNSLAIGAGDIVLTVVPQFHVNAWGIPYAGFASGAGLILPSRHTSPERLVELIEREQATMAAAVPTVWSDVRAYLRSHPGHDIGSLNRIISGGAAVPSALMRAYEEEFHIPIIQGWGMTETSSSSALAHPPRGMSGDAARPYRESAGRFVLGVEGRIVGENGAELPRDGGAIGELQVRGPWTTGSYFRSQDRSSFDSDWLRTGDIGTIDDLGYLRISDRTKDMIKSGGEWISSVDVETAIMAHPAVQEAAVIGIPDDHWQERPLALVVLNGEADTESLRAWLSERMPKWWLPEHWAFVAQVPRTGVGKFDKKAIRRMYADSQLTMEPASVGGGHENEPNGSRGP